MKNKQLLVSAIAISVGVVGALAGIIHADMIKQQTPATTSVSTITQNQTADLKDQNGQDLETNDDQVSGATVQTQTTIDQDKETQDDKNVTEGDNGKPDSGQDQEIAD